MSDVEYAERALAEAAGALGRLPCSSPLSKRMAREQRYAAAYQRLVRLGARPQIRAKYRQPR